MDRPIPGGRGCRLHCFPPCGTTPLQPARVPFSVSTNQDSDKLKKVKVKKAARLCPTLCNPMDSTIHGILQARTLEWVAFPFSRGSSQPKDGTQVFHIAGGFFYHLSYKGSPRILEWQPIPSPANLSNPGIEQGSPTLQAGSLPTGLSGMPRTKMRTEHSS